MAHEGNDLAALTSQTRRDSRLAGAGTRADTLSWGRVPVAETMLEAPICC